MDDLAQLIREVLCKADQYNTQLESQRIMGHLRQSPPIVVPHHVVSNFHTFAYCGERMCNLVINESFPLMWCLSLALKDEILH